ncbi:hypothetical protein [uncultured Photobacterium sp.]|uniref:hypothetical protein n=1 Tax=uncultured Photobacterium sp. TaxID=173973 RepID=UPI0026236B3D|nr:hypothetical protein [uncultured Photobacterium sp.]
MLKSDIIFIGYFFAQERCQKGHSFIVRLSIKYGETRVVSSVVAFSSGNEPLYYSTLHCNERIVGFSADHSGDAALRNISSGCHANVFGSKR